MPTEKQEDGAWMHPARLPLGWGWRGYCTAPGHEHAIPSDEQLRDGCNVGYAGNCPYRPNERFCDSIRFGVTKECERRIQLCYVCEKDHRPIEHGALEYDPVLRRWVKVHHNSVFQKMADCYIGEYLLRRQLRADLEISNTAQEQ